MRKMKEVIRKRLSVYRQRPLERRGYIGNLGTGEVYVSGENFTVYVTLQGGSIVQAINTTTPSALGLPVEVGYDPEDPTNIRVLRAVPAYGAGENALTGLGIHHTQHEWPGFDTTYIWSWQFLKSLVIPVPDAVEVQVYPGEYRTASGWKTFTQLTTVDLSSYVPTNAGKAKIVLIVVTNAGSFAVRDGSEVSGYDNLTDADIPSPTLGDNVICAARLFTGQEEIRQIKDGPNDLIDLRFSGVNNGGNSSNYVRIAGDTMTGELGVPSIQFDTTPPTTTPADGQLIWNPDRDTLDIDMSGGVTLQVGQEMHFFCINQTGSLIPDGAGVMFAGALGASGIIKAALSVADGTYPANYMMGIATQDIADGDTGKVTFFGEVRGFDTSGYTAGDVLYFDPDTPGGLTNVEPVAPNIRYAVAVAIDSKSNGTIFVRAIYSMGLFELNDVTLTSAVEGDILTKNGGSVWVNEPLVTVMVSENLTSQIDGSTDTFTISQAAPIIWPFVNWRGVDPANAPTATDGVTFTLGFVPTVSDHLYAQFQVNHSKVITDPNGIIITDLSGSTIFVP